MPLTGRAQIAARRREQILTCAPTHILQARMNPFAGIARQVGLSHAGARHYVPTTEELIRLLCLRHLTEAFDAVCLPADWHGTPIEVLRAMSLALLAYEDENATRHMVFLLHRQSLDAPACSANDTMLSYLTNNFQLALQITRPDSPFDSLHGAARMFLGQILHLPLWWPEEPSTTKDAWLCHQIGHLTGTFLPDWQMPPAARREEGQVPCPRATGT